MKDEQLRHELVDLLEGRGAHAEVVPALAAFPVKLAGEKPEGAPHTGWELVEHMRIAQHDILEFAKDARFESPPWPAGYWPKTPAPPDAKAWGRALASFEQDLRAMIERVSDPEIDLFASIPHGEATLLHEALILADHNAYHLGQLVMLRRQLEGR